MPNLFFIVTITFILYLIFGSPELSLLNDTISSLGGFSNLYYLFTNKDYSIKGRITNVDAAQKIAHYLHNQGKDVIVSLVSPYLDQREEFKTLLSWQLKEFHVHYNPTNGKRGREKWWVDQFQAPTSNFLDIDTTIDDPANSLIK